VRSTKGESIDAHEGDGSSSSSVEGPVMGLERRLNLIPEKSL
jgi:hypothetical protein